MKNEQVLCGKVVTPDRIIENGMVVIQDDRITYVGERDESIVESSRKLGQVQEFQQADEYLVPGFVDIHNHGGGGVWSYEDPRTFASAHLKHGTTSVLPTLVYNQTHQDMIDSLKRVLAVMEQADTSIVGIHMEGPYINPKYGAITSPIRPVNPDEYREILALAGPQIKVWTLAPELPGQTQFMEEASEYKIAFSVGHSEASAETIFNAYPLGLQIGCHLTNASGTSPDPSKYAGTREIGVHEAVMLHDHMVAEVIPDREGIHVRPMMLQLILKTKGVDQVIIITDAADGAGVSTGRDVNMILPNAFTPGATGDEILSGSLLTMDKAVHNMRLHTGIGWVETTKLASLNAARILGMEKEIGSLEPGKKANVLVVSDDVQVKMVMLEGQIVHPYK